jgi:hypothetical protein
MQDWERGLQNQEGAVEQLRLVHRQLGASSPQTDSKILFIDEKWEQMITVGNVYEERYTYSVVLNLFYILSPARNFLPLFPYT